MYRVAAMESRSVVVRVARQLQVPPPSLPPPRSLLLPCQPSLGSSVCGCHVTIKHKLCIAVLGTFLVVLCY